MELSGASYFVTLKICNGHCQSLRYITGQSPIGSVSSIPILPSNLQRPWNFGFPVNTLMHWRQQGRAVCALISQNFLEKNGLSSQFRLLGEIVVFVRSHFHIMVVDFLCLYRSQLSPKSLQISYYQGTQCRLTLISLVAYSKTN